MAAKTVIPPFPVFTDIDGNPLEDGYIYIGDDTLDPETNPKNVYWDEALTELVSQPIRTRGGYPLNSGTAARVFLSGRYSITTKNKNESVISTLASEIDLSYYTQAQLNAGQLDTRYYTETEIDTNHYTKTASDAITDTKINETNEAQTKLGDLDLGQNVAVTSWSFVTTTITVNTTTVHNLSVGDDFYVSGLVSTTNAPNGKWTVATVVDTDTITFTATDTPTGSPTVSSAILVSGITSISATEWLNDGVDIGGGETLYPDGTIYGSNANGTYTKYPNRDVTIVINETIPYSTTLDLYKLLTLPLTLASATYGADGTVASGSATTTPGESEYGQIVLRKDLATTTTLPCYIYRQANQTSWGVSDTLDVSIQIHGRY